MADLNALIAQGAQFQALPDPFVQYGRMQQLEQGQQANQLNQMKMEEAQAAAVERNALRGLDPTSPNYESQLFKVNPQLGIAYRKERTAAEAQQATQQAQQAQALKTNLDNYRSFLVGVNDQPAYDAWRASATKNIPELADMLPAAFSSDAKNLLLQTADDISKRLNAPPPAPVAPSLSPLAKLQNERQALINSGALPNDPRVQNYNAAINKEITRAPGTVVNIDSKQQGAFEAGLGKGQSDRILANQVVAQDAAAILETNKVGRDLLKSGAITGTGAEFLVGFNNALKQAGVDFGYADAASNSQAYAAAMGANVGRIIKQFGAGTGLSDADREYAAQIAGGKIGLTEASLRKILDINDRAANRVIDLHNKNVSGIKTNIPLTVEKPTFAAPPPSGANLIPGSTPAAAVVPQGAIDALKAGKGTDAQFDAIFGAGAAKRAKGGK